MIVVTTDFTFFTSQTSLYNVPVAPYRNKREPTTIVSYNGENVNSNYAYFTINP